MHFRLIIPDVDNLANGAFQPGNGLGHRVGIEDAEATAATQVVPRHAVNQTSATFVARTRSPKPGYQERFVHY